jgi:hypothetical protein
VDDEGRWSDGATKVDDDESGRADDGESGEVSGQQG